MWRITSEDISVEYHTNRAEHDYPAMSKVCKTEYLKIGDSAKTIVGQHNAVELLYNVIMQLTKSHRIAYVLPSLSETFWAYLAGFVDGEAHIRKYFVRNTSIGKNYGYEMTISQNRENGGEQIFNWIKGKLGLGTLTIRKLEKPEKDVFLLQIAQRNALYEILKKILPYSHIKRTVIQKILNDIELVYGQSATHG